MNAEMFLQAASQQGWTESTQLALLLSFINDLDRQDQSFKMFLKGVLEDEADN